MLHFDHSASESTAGETANQMLKKVKTTQITVHKYLNCLSLVSSNKLLVLVLLSVLSSLSQAKKGDLFFSLQRTCAVTQGVLPLLTKGTGAFKSGKHSLTFLFFSQLHTWFPQASIDSCATVLIESKQISPSSVHCLFNLSSDRISWFWVLGIFTDKKGIIHILHNCLIPTIKIIPVSTNIQLVFTLLEKCRGEWEQEGKAGEIISPILWTTWDIVVCIFTKQPWIVELLRPAVKKDFVQTSQREIRRASLGVTQFASSSQDTLQQLALQELLCNYQQQQQGK